MATDKIASDIWQRVARLEATEPALVEGILTAEVLAAVRDGDLRRAADQRVALVLHLQKTGRLTAAEHHLSRIDGGRSSPEIQFEKKFYLAKVLAQRGRFPQALRLYEGLEQQLRSGALSLADADVLSRMQTLIWRQGFARILLAGSPASGRNLFALHRELMPVGSNQVAINHIFGHVLPSLMTQPARDVECLDEAMAATTAYEVVNLSARFTHPSVALVQRDLLQMVSALRQGSNQGTYEATIRAGLRLRSAGATASGEGIAEFVTVLGTHLPELPDLLIACTSGPESLVSILSRTAHPEELAAAMVSISEEHLSSAKAPSPTVDLSRKPDGSSDRESDRNARSRPRPLSPTVY